MPASIVDRESSPPARNKTRRSTTTPHLCWCRSSAPLRHRALFEVLWSHQAVADMDRLDQRTFERIDSATDPLAMTGEGDISRLHDERVLRLRVGEWRVLCEQHGEIIPLLAVRPRGRAH